MSSVADLSAAREAGNPPEYIPTAQRAAVIISVLGEEAAKPIVEKLDSTALDNVQSMLNTVHTLPARTTAKIIIEFIEFLTGTPGVLLSGKNQVQKLISQIEVMRNEAMGDMEVGDDGFAQLDLDILGMDEQQSVWERLEKHDPEKIAEYLNRLTPNLIALIMRQMSISQSSDIFSVMDEEKLPDIMGYLVDTKPEDPAIQQVVEKMVEIEFLCAQQDVSDGEIEHLQSMGELLSLIPAAKRDKIVNYLETEHESKLHDIQKSLFTIEGLPETLPRNAIPLVVKEIDPDDFIKLIVSLQTTNAEVAEFFLSNISSRQATQVKEDVTKKSALSDEENETVQRNLLVKLMDMKRDGIINLLPS